MLRVNGGQVHGVYHDDRGLPMQGTVMLTILTSAQHAFRVRPLQTSPDRYTTPVKNQDYYMYHVM